MLTEHERTALAAIFAFSFSPSQQRSVMNKILEAHPEMTGTPEHLELIAAIENLEAVVEAASK